MKLAETPWLQKQHYNLFDSAYWCYLDHGGFDVFVMCDDLLRSEFKFPLNVTAIQICIYDDFAPGRQWFEILPRGQVMAIDETYYDLSYGYGEPVAKKLFSEGHREIYVEVWYKS